MSKLIGNQEFSGSTFILGVGSYNGANPSAGTNDVASVLEGIGGKQELKSGQTISYRKTNVDYDAGAADIKKIYGKTYAWNQLVQNGDFSSTSNWTTLYSNISVSGGVITVTKTVDNANVGGMARQTVPIINTHKYYISVYAKTNSTDIPVNLSFTNYLGQMHGNTNFSTSSSAFTKLFGIVTPVDNDDLLSLRVGSSTSPSGSNGDFKNCICVDLTLLYGSAIDSMTNAEILAKFESEFSGYHEYNGGTLISNDAESLETVGFNLWDEEWERGGINGNTGNKYPDDNAIRSKNYISISPGSTYCLRHTRNINIGIYYYGANKNYISAVYDAGNAFVTFTTPSNAVYLLIKIGAAATPVTKYAHDVCINLSDPAKNGTYEPYEKHTLPLNLNSFDVIDASGNTITITGGLKSAGNVYDEIVGNKYIKRVGSVDMGTLTAYYVVNTSGIFTCNRPVDATQYMSYVLTEKYIYSKGEGFSVQQGCISDTSSSSYPRTWFMRDDSMANKTAAEIAAALSGVMLYYELATPITYELVSPLITEYPVDKNGTERAVYENEADVHAPLVADIQYGVTNNDTAANITKIANMSKEIEALLAQI